MITIELVGTPKRLIDHANDAQESLEQLSRQAIKERNYTVASRSVKLHNILVASLFKGGKIEN